MRKISKQLGCQKFIFKIHSTRLRKEKWNLTLSIEAARKNDEIISLADSQILRWIDNLNGIEGADFQARAIKSQIRRLRKESVNIQNKRSMKQLYNELDALQFKPDYMCLIIDREKDYRRACKGYSINGIKYKRLLGTNGGIKNSTIVFVSERLYDSLKEKIENGRDMAAHLIPAKLEAYKALTCSASNPVSFPKGILIVPDVKTSFKSDIVYLANYGENEPTMEYRENQEICLNASDGYGLMLPSLAQRWSEELGLDYMMSGCNTRFAFEKGMVVTFDFLEFADKIAQNYTVKDAWGNEVDIRGVELILTTSMVKLWNGYENCGDYISKSLNNGYTFGVAKVCPKNLENERNLNYQFIQSYQLNDNDIDKLITPTINEFSDVLGGDWRKAVLFLKGLGLNEKNVDKLENDYIKAIMIDNRIFNDGFVRNSIYQLIKNRINKAKVGVIKVHGNYSMIVGDPYLLCQSIFGLELTGLLKAGEVFNEYWANQNNKQLACFRAPMTCHNNIRSVTVACNDDVRFWYGYIHTATIYNGWDTATLALNGADYDGDLNMLTDNDVLVKKLKKLPAIMCMQNTAKSKIVNDDDLLQSNIDSFGNEIGAITNRITSMFEVQSGFSPQSDEYKILDYRIKCGQLLQQDEIDRSKGVVSKRMPKEWHDFHSINKLEDDNIKRLYKRILADKKPYFMRYIYPALMKKYNEYIRNTDKNAVREFQITVSELKSMPYESLTERQKEFLIYYDRRMPVGVNNCVMNKICRKFEEKFDGFTGGVKKEVDFDYKIMKIGVEYTIKQYSSIKKLYDEYNKKLAEYLVHAATERIDECVSAEELSELNENFRRQCDLICPNKYVLCDIVLDICYTRNSTKKFAWAMCGNEIINNLLFKNEGRISYPQLDENGDFEYCGERFRVKNKKIEVDKTW